MQRYTLYLYKTTVDMLLKLNKQTPGKDVSAPRPGRFKQMIERNLRLRFDNQNC